MSPPVDLWGQGCDMEWALGVARVTDARTSDMKQCLWGQHRWWDISVCHASSVSSFRSSLKTSFHKSFLSFLCPEICAWQLIHVRSNLYPLDSWYTPDLMCTGQLVHVGSNLYPLDSWYTLDLTAQLIYAKSNLYPLDSWYMLDLTYTHRTAEHDTGNVYLLDCWYMLDLTCTNWTIDTCRIYLIPTVQLIHARFNLLLQDSWTCYI